MRGAIAREPAGAVLAGRYQVASALGTGGMGTVYQAVDRATGRLVAVKVLDPRKDQHPTTLDQRFAREIAAVQQLQSPHAVRLIDAGTLGDGRHFMAMEHLEGADLHRILDKVGRLPMQRAVRLIRQACTAIAEAHALGIVHRDVKPANLFVTCLPDGTECLKVLDFGISKLPQTTMEELALTVTGAVLGSPVYMSPEQMTCSRDVDARSDIWALGVVLYQCLSGGFPYQADAMPQLCARVLTEAPIPLSAQVAVPMGLEAVVMRCLARDPDHRFASALELAAALLPFSGEGGGGEQQTVIITRARMPLGTPLPSDRTPLPVPLQVPAVTMSPRHPVFVEPEPEIDAGRNSRVIYLLGAFAGLAAGILYMLYG
jgi:eukaryotic-like serine/threonine-protein kinase